MLWVISYGIYPLTKIMEMGKANLRKTNTNTEIYVKNQKEKKTTERGSTMIMAITMVFGVLGFLGSIGRPPMLEGIYYLYK